MSAMTVFPPISFPTAKGDPDICRGKPQFNIIRKIDDLADLDTLVRLQLISCHRRPLADIRDRDLYTEGSERLLKTVGSLLEFTFSLIICSVASLFKKRKSRSNVAAVLARSGCPAGISQSGSGFIRLSVDSDPLQFLLGGGGKASVPG